ncbi:ATP-binding protein [Streptomyces globosus]|uniref:ATP-binding protein n=1 Tax=Streptomyces globosus TaxID=68209 RepID=UPI0031DFA1A6
MGLQRARRVALQVVGLYRLAHLLYAAGVVTADPVDARAAAILAAVCAVTLAVYGAGLRHGRIPDRLMWTDAGVNGCLLPLAAAVAIGEGPAAEAHGWLAVQALSASAAAVVSLRWRGTVLCFVLLTATSLAVHQVVRRPDTAGLLEHLSALAMSSGLMAVGWWYVRRQGILLDDAQQRALAAEAARARQAERTAHHAALHDTVLATLTTIASGGVDANAQAVRDRCAREAAYLRRLVQLTDDPGPGRPPPAGGTAGTAALEEAVRSAEALGLVVKAQYHAVPELPGDIAAAVAAAASEALNNVRRHAGTGLAYLTAAGRAGGLEVTVADRGSGFDPADTAGAGTGLRRSVHARMAAAGRAARVDSHPGEGTVVELRWPA